MVGFTRMEWWILRPSLHSTSVVPTVKPKSASGGEEPPRQGVRQLRDAGAAIPGGLPREERIVRVWMRRSGLAGSSVMDAVRGGRASSSLSAGIWK
jgi:hypothetical protein